MLPLPVRFSRVKARRCETTGSSSSPMPGLRAGVAVRLRISCRASRPPRDVANSSGLPAALAAAGRGPRRLRSRPVSSAGGTCGIGGPPGPPRSPGRPSALRFCSCLLDMLGKWLRAGSTRANRIDRQFEIRLLGSQLSFDRLGGRKHRLRHRRQFDRRGGSGRRLSSLAVGRFLPRLTARPLGFDFGYWSTGGNATGSNIILAPNDIRFDDRRRRGSLRSRDSRGDWRLRRCFCRQSWRGSNRSRLRAADGHRRHRTAAGWARRPIREEFLQPNHFVVRKAGQRRCPYR